MIAFHYDLFSKNITESRAFMVACQTEDLKVASSILAESMRFLFI